MAAFLSINKNSVDKEVYFTTIDTPTKKYEGIKPEHIKSIKLNGKELEYAIDQLGAANVKKSIVTYYGDEAKRIFFNWG